MANDLISRQAAITELNEIAEMKNAILDSLDISDRRARDMIEAELGQINGDIDSIKNMPSAEPEQKMGKWIDYSDEGYVECPFCHSATNCEDNKDELHYCFSCGAELR